MKERDFSNSPHIQHHNFTIIVLKLSIWMWILHTRAECTFDKLIINRVDFSDKLLLVIIIINSIVKEELTRMENDTAWIFSYYYVSQAAP